MELQMEQMNEIKRALQREQRQLMLRKFFRNKLAVIGSSIVLTLVLVAIFADVIAPQDPLDMVVRDRLTPPGSKYLFGADTFGRDVLSRVIHGARVSMLVGTCVGLSSMVFGMLIGLYACYYSFLDNVLMRICDGLSAIPSTLLAIALMAVLGSTATNVIVAMSIVYVPRMARVSRAAAMVVKEQTYIEAMRATGASDSRIIWRHIAPNILSPVIVQASYNFANSIITEAALSFLGVGIPVPQPSWGNILNEGKSVITTGWWLIVFPGAATALAVLGLNILGDGLRDMLDPHTN
ncbi:MAG TPA: ABC transporter permease [Firmicutes bacterium]|nr:ABC transporter permease [Candidatus Fermentithermobacillaceae bacterium]